MTIIIGWTAELPARAGARIILDSPEPFDFMGCMLSGTDGLWIDELAAGTTTGPRSFLEDCDAFRLDVMNGTLPADLWATIGSVVVPPSRAVVLRLRNVKHAPCTLRGSWLVGARGPTAHVKVWPPVHEGYS